MSSILFIAIAVVSSYLIGAIPMSFIMAKMAKGVDIREAGSKNVGATNVFRVAGKIPGAIALILDILKGILVVTLLCGYLYKFTENMDYGFYRSLMGLVAICGHIWPIYLGFKGGKGVATTIGVMMIIAPWVLITSLIVWVIVFFLTNYVSLASLALGLSFPMSALFLNQPFYITIFSVIICIIISYKHKSNINRLLKGEENKTMIFKKR